MMMMIIIRVVFLILYLFKRFNEKNSSIVILYHLIVIFCNISKLFKNVVKLNRSILFRSRVYKTHYMKVKCQL